MRTFGAGESAYTFCEPADEVLPAHHNGDTAGSLEKKLIGRHPPGRPKGPAEPRCHHVIIIIIVHPFASRDLVFGTNQGAVASIRERSLPCAYRQLHLAPQSPCNNVTCLAPRKLPVDFDLGSC
jgi:hypothetical protein